MKNRYIFFQIETVINLFDCFLFRSNWLNRGCKACIHQRQIVCGILAMYLIHRRLHHLHRIGHLLHSQPYRIHMKFDHRQVSVMQPHVINGPYNRSSFFVLTISNRSVSDFQLDLFIFHLGEFFIKKIS